jgi:gamma-glutamyltranspeptidase
MQNLIHLIFLQHLLEELRARGHDTKEYDTIPGSVVVSIQRWAPDHDWYAVTDKRKEGDVDGF